jgi:DNA-binding LytR/AlgR family response regulator
MIIRQEERPEQNDIEIFLTYPNKNKTVDFIIEFLNSVDTKIECYADTFTVQVKPSDIYYIESTDKTAVVYCKNEHYKTKYRLYQIYEELSNKGFVQVSKYCLVNIYKLEKIKPLHNKRMEAVLSNGSRIFITRKYCSAVKRFLQENVK